VNSSVNPTLGLTIPLAPSAFDGILRELYEQHILKVLPDVDEVVHQHRELLAYCQQSDPAFLVRAVSTTTRGDCYETASGSRFIATDNAPAWWMHFVVFNRIRDARIEDAPKHMFDASRVQPNVNTAGWHVAHIYNAKDRRTDWSRWDREELVRRFIRNVHPCNCFYVPKTDWRRYGGDPAVMGFIAERYRGRYGDVWEEFIRLSAGEPLPRADGELRYVYPLDAQDSMAKAAITPTADSANVAATYRYSRLCFRADVIEPLQDDDVFEVVTPEGRFRMTKAEFSRAFPGVVASRSYREGRIYHYPKVPQAALPYRLPQR
jgi:hypothetical protein